MSFLPVSLVDAGHASGLDMVILDQHTATRDRRHHPHGVKVGARRSRCRRRTVGHGLGRVPYLYCAVVVVLAMAGFGFAVGSGVVVPLGIDWNWVAVLVGLAFGAAPVHRGDRYAERR